MDDALVTPQTLPWAREGALTRVLMTDETVNGKQRFHLVDCWHALHLGIGKSWAASGLMMLQNIREEGDQDLRIGALCAEYRAFCSRCKLDPIIRKFDKYSLGGGGSNEPNGTWSKAAVTSNMLLFLEDYCQRNMDKLRGDQQLEVFVAILHLCNTHFPFFNKYQL